jgi:hypothetical protein
MLCSVSYGDQSVADVFHADHVHHGLEAACTRDLGWVVLGSVVRIQGVHESSIAWWYVRLKGSGLPLLRCCSACAPVCSRDVVPGVVAVRVHW